MKAILGKILKYVCVAIAAVFIGCFMIFVITANKYMVSGPPKLAETNITLPLMNPELQEHFEKEDTNKLQ